MKSLLKVTAAILVLAMSNNASAQSSNSAVKKHDKLDAKCHVEVLGGKQAIYFAMVTQGGLSKLSKSISHKKVRTVDSKEKLKIHKVFECVLSEDEFTKASARSLDKITPR